MFRGLGFNGSGAFRRPYFRGSGFRASGLFGGLKVSGLMWGLGSVLTACIYVCMCVCTYVCTYANGQTLTNTDRS